MAIDREDEERLTARFDERYVRQRECDDKHTEVERRFADGDTNFALITHDLSIIKWGLGIVASTSVATLIKSILELIIK